MFRFTLPALRAPLAAAVLVALYSAAWGQAAPAGTTQTAPAPRTSGPTVSSRVRANRQARVARNIQETYSHRWEVAGGGGFLRFREGQYLQKISQINFFTTANYYLNPQLSIAADVRGMYGNGNIPNVFALNGVYSPQISEYTFMAGPQYRFLVREKYAVSAAATAGVGLSKFGGDAKGLQSQDLGLWPDSNSRPAFSLSLIGDYNLYNNLAFRVQPTYLGTTFGGTVQNNLGVELGFVYRFGHQ